MKDIVKQFLIFLFCLIWVLPASAQYIPETYDFFVEDKLLSVDLSPDGSKVVMIEENPFGQAQLRVLDLESGKYIPTSALNDVRVKSAVFADNDRILAGHYILADMKLPNGVKANYGGKLLDYMPNVLHKRMLAYSLSRDVKVDMFKDPSFKVGQNLNLGRITSVLPGDPDHILMPAQDGNPSLFKVNLNTGLAKRIEKGRPSTVFWQANDDGVPVMRIDSDFYGNYVKIYTRPSEGGSWSKLVTLREKNFKETAPIAQARAEAGGKDIFYVAGRPEGADLTSVYKYDFKSKSYLEKVTQNTAVDVHAFIVDKSGKFIGTVFFEDHLTYEFVDPAYKSQLETLRQKLGDEVNIFIQQVSSNGSRWLIYTEGPQEPGKYYTYSVPTQNLKSLASRTAKLRSSHLGQTEVINYTATDGTPLKGYLTHPPGPRSTADAMIVLPHGGPEARDYISYDPMVQYLANQGFRVFQPNFRESSGYGEAFAQAGYGQWGGVMQDDITDGVQHLIASGITYPGKICIAGVSYGGYAALMGAVKTPDLYSCAISINGVTDLIAQAKFDAKKFKGDRDLVDYVYKSIGHPRKDKARLQQTSPAMRASEIKIPVMIFQGTLDQTVPPDQGQRMRDALKAAGHAPKYFEIKMDHNLTHDDAKRKRTKFYPYMKVIQDMADFADEHTQ